MVPLHVNNAEPSAKTMQSEPRLRVIILEDNPADVELMQLELRKNGLQADYTLTVSHRDFTQALEQQEPDLVLADYTLPGFDGLTALREVRARYPFTPFVFVSGSLGEERAIDALKNGATDYVIKDRLQRLSAVVNRAIRENVERRERHLSNQALEQQRLLVTAIVDSLPDDIYAVDAASRLTVINQAMLQRLGQQRTDILGKRLNELPDQPNAREMELLDAMVLNSGRSIVEQERVVDRPDGSVSWLVSSRIPLRDHQNKPVGVVCTERDLTQRKRMEQEILDISDREQRRLGSDLHDGLGQEMTGLSLMLKGLEVQMANDSSTYLPQIIKINALVSRTIQNTRSLARGLAPVNLSHGGIREAFKQLAARCSNLYQLNCVFVDNYQHHGQLEESMATQIYRIAQEATTNAARHAHADNLRIELRSTTRRLYLSITDNGIGLSRPSGAEETGMGLKIMEYRARILGGSIHFERIKTGTRVALSCPLKTIISPAAAPRAANR